MKQIIRLINGYSILSFNDPALQPLMSEVAYSEYTREDVVGAIKCTTPVPFEQLCGMLDLSISQEADWKKPGAYSLESLLKLVALIKKHCILSQGDAAASLLWWDTPHAMLQGRSPRQVSKEHSGVGTIGTTFFS